ncbi:hypothetical protein [Spiroplasma sp. DGKH1]|uniref:hypothetical protein n=1 Tax=Spiroplasma sp. DGKH1 TaxID=3050074 RepID=UPI0034C5F69C
MKNYEAIKYNKINKLKEWIKLKKFNLVIKTWKLLIESFNSLKEAENSLKIKVLENNYMYEEFNEIEKLLIKHKILVTSEINNFGQLKFNFMDNDKLFSEIETIQISNYKEIYF